jgi:hypothetical protein
VGRAVVTTAVEVLLIRKSNMGFITVTPPSRGAPAHVKQTHYYGALAAHTQQIIFVKNWQRGPETLLLLLTGRNGETNGPSTQGPKSGAPSQGPA